MGDSTPPDAIVKLNITRQSQGPIIPVESGITRNISLRFPWRLPPSSGESIKTSGFRCPPHPRASPLFTSFSLLFSYPLYRFFVVLRAVSTRSSDNGAGRAQYKLRLAYNMSSLPNLVREVEFGRPHLQFPNGCLFSVAFLFSTSPGWWRSIGRKRGISNPDPSRPHSARWALSIPLRIRRSR